MKKDYGLVNREEGPLFGAPVLPRRDDRKGPKRLVAIGSSVLLLAAGAVLGYAAMPSRSAPASSISNLEANAPTDAQMSIMVESVAELPIAEPVPATGGDLIAMPPVAVPLDAVAITHAYMPPVSELDLNKDGLVSVEEYLHRSIRRHDATLKRVETSVMSDVAKDFIIDRLRHSYAREAWCVAQIAAKDIAAGGMAMSDFKVFYTMIQNTCDFYDPDIPREFQPGDKPLPTDAPIDPSTPAPTTPTKQPIRKFYPTEIPENHAIKCEWDDSEVYRYTNGVRRLYPNEVIAASWDPFWYFALVADCSMLTRGDDMELNGSTTPAPRMKMLPQDLQEGQAMKCEWDEPEVYRYTNGVRRWYPNPPIASSWDPYWDAAVVVECAYLPRGDDMEMFGNPLETLPPFRMKTPPALLYEGQPIKCDFSEAEVYRFENNVRRWYPSPEIAASWDPNWGSFIEANCSTLLRGDDMELKKVPSPWTPPVKLTPGQLSEGQAIKCEWDEPQVFRFTADMRRWYPSDEIAASYDPFWHNAVVADCSLILRGDDMPAKETPTQPPTVPPTVLIEGQTIKCSPNPDIVYRWTNGVYRGYTSGAMAGSYDVNWWMAPMIDCTNLVRGKDMDEFNTPSATTPPPALTLREGQTIKCSPNPDFVYRWTNGVYRFYPSGAMAASYDVDWWMAPIIDCTNLVRGDDMDTFNGTPPPPPPPVKVPVSMLYEGQAIKCDESDEVFRFTDGMRRYYPSHEIADSWDPYWPGAVLAECNDLPRGKDMRLRSPTMFNGQAVRCDGDDNSRVYRFWDGSIFEYPDLDVAASWDATWSWTVIVVDCSSLPKGPAMQKKLPPPVNLPEGHTIKCGTMEDGFFRYTSGVRRLYPTMAIAMSWDPNWDVVALEVDCSSLPRGDDMDFYQPPLVEGMSVNCGDSTAVFRYTNGTIRLYPTHQIADSWDPMWYYFIRVNCARLTRGPDMQMKPVPLTNVHEGQPVQCIQDDALRLYRFASGEVRLYPNSEIQLSWDALWGDAVLIDCSQVRFGRDMEYKQPPLFDGQTVKCSSDAIASYRYWNGTIRPYPEFRIAQSWGQVAESDEALWLSATLVYCPGFALGPEMRFNLGKLVEGQPIVCNHDATEIYRYTSGQRRLYPTTVIAAMWDPMWRQFVLVDCSRLVRGEDMKLIPPYVPDGRSVRCLDTEALACLKDGVLRLYPSNEVAMTWDPEWMDPILIDCTGLPQGPPMKRKLPSPFTLPEGQAIKCDDDEVEVYRYTSGMRRLYPSETIALSWDLDWEKYEVVDCSMLPRGANMQSKWPLKEGETVRCGPGSGLFRYTNGTIRLYPSDAVALSWDPNALMVATVIDCRRYPLGPNMAIRSPMWIPEGHAIKCSPADTETYRFACGDRRLYPNAEIAESWDPNWKNPMIVDCKWIFSSYPMQMYTPPVPAMLTEEQTVTCAGDSRYFRFCSGELRLYLNDKIGRSWDRNYVSNSVVIDDCMSLHKGNTLLYRKPNIPEGQAVTCDNSGDVYRYENLVLRRYPSHEVAAYWDSNWMNAVALECEFFMILGDMPWPFPRFNLTEGQSTKCDANKPEYYRYASGVLRLYPTTEIASSWDPNWSNFTVVNCSTFSRGPNMEPKQPPLKEGQPVKCDDGYSIYRYTNHTLRLYPTPEIAASWDPMYTTATRINCTAIFRDANMKLKLPPPTGLPEGQAIKCDPNESAVYRLVSGQRRWYPSPYIASSWDNNWSNSVLIDCTYLPEGPPMRFNQPYIYQYQAIKCDDGSPVYRYNNGTIRWYPSPEIASSWDPNWPNAIKVDCSNFTRGRAHDFKLRSPVGLPEGQAIRCGETRTDIYRLTGGQMRWYPSPEIAWSWDPTWQQSIVVDCEDLPFGNPMPYNYPILTEGQAIKCDTGSAVYRYSNGAIRWYPSPEIAWSWDANWMSAIMVDCTYLQKGPSLDFKLRSPFGLPEGQAIKCKMNTDVVFRLSCDQMRWYPSPAIATSWDPYWSAAIAVDCSYLTRGIDMKFNQPPIVEGQPVKCDDSSMIFRYVNGSIHFYPSPEIAWSWDHNYMFPTFVDCSVLPRGPDLKLREIDGWKQLDGSMVQLSFDGTQLCGVNHGGDAWCAIENIRGEGVTTWRRLPGTFSRVVVYGDVLYGIDASNSLFVGSAVTSDPSWTKLPGSFKYISTDNKQLCGVTPGNTLQCADSDIRTAPNWRKIVGTFSQVELVNGRLFGVREDMGLFAGRAYGDPQWFYLRSPMEQMSFDGVRVCGTTNGQVKCASNGLSTGPQWSASLGSMHAVIVNAGDMYAVSPSGAIFYRAVE